MKKPTRAIVLAAGLGTRMLPLTNEIPKALLPFRGIPMLQRTLQMLSIWGVTDTLVNTHHHAPQIFDHLLNNTPRGMRISVSFEHGILGTGGALWKAGWFVDSEPFWLINADVVARLSPRALINDFTKNKPLATLWVDQKRGPRTVRVSHGNVECFADPKPGSHGTTTFCGLHLLSPRILNYIDSGFSSIIDAYRGAMKKGETIRTVAVKGAYWSDIGTPAQYLAACSEAPARLPGTNKVSNDIVIPANIHINNSAILPGARVLAGSKLSNAIVGPGVIAGGRIDELVTKLSTTSVPELLKAADKLGWPRERCFVSHLPARGSARAFHRLGCGRKRAMVITYSLDRPENGLYASHTKLLAKAAIPVPTLLHTLRASKTLVMEDLGNESLTDYCRSHSRQATLRMYKKIIAITARLHTDTTMRVKRSNVVLCEPFSKKLCKWEYDLFISCFLRGQLHERKAVVQRLRKDLDQLCRRFLSQPKVLLHRDLQSSNVLIKQGQPYLIDFQGMRMGPAMYDVASLLCDPYVALDSAMQHELLNVYADLTGIQRGKASMAFRFAATQRLLQAIGAFARLSALPGTQNFNIYTPPSLATLSTVLKGISGLDYLQKKMQEWSSRIRELSL